MGVFTKKIVGVFQNGTLISNILNELNNAGLGSSHISILAKDTANIPEKNSGTFFKPEAEELSNEINYSDTQDVKNSELAPAAGMIAGLGLLIIPGIGPVLAAGALAAAAQAFTSVPLNSASEVITGILKNDGVPGDRAYLYSSHFEQGDIILIIDHNEDQKSLVTKIINKNNPVIFDSF